MLQKEDGSTMRWTRRPDGTWRKPEHTRAGWVGDLEQTKYVSKGAQFEQQRQAQMQAQVGRIPGAPPEASQPEGNKSKTSQKNEQKKEKRKEKAEENDNARLQKLAGETVDNNSADMAQDGAGGKNEKAIRKKIRQIEDLEAKQKQGEVLNDDQLAKLAARKTLEAELKAVLAGETVPSAPAPAPASAPPAAAPAASTAPAAAAATAAAAEPAAAAASKSRKALEKKLRQIAEVEEKQRKGETLSDDQLAKLATKKELEAELARCA
jgi:uncharacterized protein with WD repeat